MNLHWLQHVPFEGLGSIEKWAVDRCHNLSVTRLFQNELPPDPDSFDMLIIMGGPMGIYDNEQYPWLPIEKDFIKEAVAAAKPILGICLGAQLLADALGAAVEANGEKEIGWFPVSRKGSVSGELGLALPEVQTVFHWHGDTFALPEASKLLYSSSACKNQAFLYGDRIIGLQFHLEMTEKGRGLLIDNCRDELIAAPWIQTEKLMLATDDYFDQINRVMSSILDYLASTATELLSPHQGIYPQASP